MSVIKNAKTGKWEVRTYFKNIDGQLKQKTRRGFKLKSEALQWEHDFKNQRNFSLDMTFARFCEIYFGDIEPRLKHNTMLTKRHIVEHKILPYFKDKKINAIKPADIIQWQNILIKSGLSSTYLKTIHNQLSAIFNHAVNLYELKANPAKKAGKIGSKTPDSEMQFWTKNEYLLFREAIADKAISYYAFEVLYWTGCRLGDDDDKIRLNQRKPSKYKGLSRFGPEKNLQRINKFMKERPTFYKKLIQMKENFRFYLRCFYCITKVVILQFNSEKQDRISS